MLIRKQPGAVGVRSARTFVAASTQRYKATTGLGLTANAPFHVVMWARRTGTGTGNLFSLGVSDIGTSNRRVRYLSTTTIDARAIAAGGNSSGTLTVTSGDPWASVIGDFASETSRRVYVGGVASTEGTTSTTIAVDPDTITVGYYALNNDHLDGGIAHVAVFAGGVTAESVARHAIGAHPTQLPGRLLECWDLDRVGPIRGLIRGTVLSPTNGGSLAPGPSIQGPPTTAKQFYFSGPTAALVQAATIGKKQPGAVGVRSARTFVAASTQYLLTTSIAGFGLAANDPRYLVAWIRRDAAVGMILAQIGRNGSNGDGHRITTEGSDTVSAVSVEAGGATASAASAAASFVSGQTHYPVIAEFGSASSRRIIVNGVAVSNTTTRTLTNGPDTLSVGASPVGSSACSATFTSFAVFAGTASDALIAAHKAGVHPTQLPGQLLECWQLDRVGPIRGLVRGTVLSPSNGGSLTAGPSIQGPPQLRRMFTGAGGATNYTITADSGTVAVTGTAAALKKAYRIAADAASAAISGTSAALLRAYRLVADTTSVAVAGTLALLQRMFRLGADSGSVAATGTASGLQHDRVIVAEPGTVTITGTDATLTYSGGSPPPRKTFMLMGVQK